MISCNPRRTCFYEKESSKPANERDFFTIRDNSETIQAFQMKLPQNTLYLSQSISIGSWPTNGVSKRTEGGFDFPASRYPSGTGFRNLDFHWFPGRPMRFRDERTPDSNSRPRIIFGELQNVLRFRPQIRSIRTDRSNAVTQASRQSPSLDCSPEKEKNNKRNDLFFYSKSESFHFRTFLLK